jgi:acetyl esterase/lipase
MVRDREYKLNFESDVDAEEDYLGKSRDVPVVVDRKSALLIPVGTTVDFHNVKGRTGFAIILPEIDLGPPTLAVSLTEARRGFKTKLVGELEIGLPPPQPPDGVFRLVRYKAALGKPAAYLTPDPKDGKKHPAIIWIHGGNCQRIDEACWEEGPAANDQSASSYRKAGIVMMFPCLRSGNDYDAPEESFLGEVDDVLAAAEFLRKQTFVDPDRIYLGGHSTGGTLALLTAECSDRFRAVFSFGPAADVFSYGPRYNNFVLTDPKELRLRAPVLWLHSIRSPVFVFEGSTGNLDALQVMAKSSKNPNVRFFEVKGADHFNVLAPTNRLIADKILRDTEPRCRLSFTEEEVNKPFAKSGEKRNQDQK